MAYKTPGSVRTIEHFRRLPRGTKLRTVQGKQFVVVSPKFCPHRDKFVEIDCHHLEDMIVDLDTGEPIHWSNYMDELIPIDEGKWKE